MKESRFKETGGEKGKRIYLVDPTNSSKIVAGLKYDLSKAVAQISAYDKDYMKLVETQTNISFLAHSDYAPFKDKLLKKQKGLCAKCTLPITPELADEGNIHLHHIKPVARRGSRNDVANLQLLHTWCHGQHHLEEGKPTNGK